ncbi:MAG: hypothetical protein EWM73_02785 [Nitrospira sp.]|nr:MAG: hypothetical protein EWM73_02785 [Nitrospira sp.]
MNQMDQINQPLPTLHFLVQGPDVCPFLPHIPIVTVQENRQSI